MKKIICLVIPSLHAGGMERVMSELAQQFSYHNTLEVHLVMYGIDPVQFYPLPSNLFIHKPTRVFNNKYRALSSLRRMWFLRKEIIKINPDSVLSFGEYWNSFVLLALSGTKFPVYVSDRCQPDKKLAGYHQFLRNVLYKRASGVIVQTSKAKEIYKRFVHPARLFVIGNPIRNVEPSAISLRGKIILSVGRLISTKHHDLLIDMFAELNMPDWKLVIVGGNALKKDNYSILAETISDRGLQDRIVLTGEQKNVEIYYHQASIFAFTSSSEGFPNVIGEALAYGLPVVAFDCIAGPSELIENDINGFLVPLFDREQFKNRLRALMTNESLRNKMAILAANSISKYNAKNISDQYLEVILS